MPPDEQAWLDRTGGQPTYPSSWSEPEIAQPAAAPASDFGFDTSLEVGARNLGAAVDVTQLKSGLALQEDVAAQQRFEESPLDYAKQAALSAAAAPTKLLNTILTGGALPEAAAWAATDFLSRAARMATPEFLKDEKRKEAFAKDVIVNNKQELRDTFKALSKLPPNPHTEQFLSRYRDGDYVDALKALPQAATYLLAENIPAYAGAAAITGGTALATRSPAATAGAANIARTFTGMSEVGSDFRDITAAWAPEDWADDKKVDEAINLAFGSSAARSAVELALPGFSKLAPAGKARLLLAAPTEFAAGAGGEAAASAVRGQDVSGGELFLEGIVGVPGVAVESGIELRDSARLKELTTLKDQAYNAIKVAEELSGNSGLAEVAKDGAHAAMALQASGKAQEAITQLELPLYRGEGVKPTETLTAPSSPIVANEATPAEDIEAVRLKARILEDTASKAAAVKDEASSRINTSLQMDLPVDPFDVAQAQRAEQTEVQARTKRESLEGIASQQMPLPLPAERLNQGLNIQKTRGGDTIIQNPSTGDTRVVSIYEDRIKAAAEKRIKTEQAALSKNTSAWEAKKAKHEELLVSARDATPANVRAGMQSWEARNPRPALQPVVAKTVEELSAPPTAKPTKTGKAPKAKVDLAAKQAALKQQAGLESVEVASSEEAGVDSDTNVRNVLDDITTSLDYKQAVGTLKAIPKGRVVVHPTGKSMPVQTGQTQGVFRTKDGTVHLNAEILGRKRNVSEALLHEAAHKAEGGYTKNKSIVTALLGPKRTLELSNYVSKQADMGNKLAGNIKNRAQAAYVRAIEQRIPEERAQSIYLKELFGYGTEEVERQRKAARPLGGMRNWASDVGSAVKLGAKKHIGLDFKLTPELVHYVTRTNLTDILNAEGKTNSTDQLESIVGEKARNFPDLAKANPEYVYVGPEGKKKIEISDRNSSVNPAAPKILRERGGMRLSSYLTHDMLFNQYPSDMVVTADLKQAGGGSRKSTMAYRKLEDIRIKVGKEGYSDGAYNPSSDVIIVSPRMIDNPQALREVVMHEIQHAIQIREGFNPGASFFDLYAEEASKIGKQITLKDDSAERFPRPEGMSEAEHEAILAKAWERYDKNAGEAEARLSENNFKMSEGELRERMPLERMTTTAGERLPAKELLLESVVDESAEPTPVSRVGAALKAALYSGKGSQQLTEAYMYSGGQVAGIAVHIDNAARNWQYAEGRIARDRNISREDIRAEVDNRLKTIDSEDSRVVRNQMYDALERDYPGIGSSVRAIRDLKWDLTRRAFALDLKRGQLDEKDLAIWAKALANEERYTTRGYIATLGGKKKQLVYGRELLKKAGADPTSEEADIVQEALDFLIQHQLIIPDADGFKAMSKPAVARMFSAWTGQVPGGRKKKTMVAALLQMEARTPEQLKDKAHQIVLELLGQTKQVGPLTSAILGARINRSILEARTVMPEPLRKLLGEITDYQAKETLTVSRLANLVSRMQLFDELANMGDSVAGAEKAEWREVQLTGKQYGTLDGKWVSRDVFNMVSDTIETQATIDDVMTHMLDRPEKVVGRLAGGAVKGASFAAGMWKRSAVVYSAARMATNLIGSGTMAVANGVINPVRMGVAFKRTAQALRVASGFASGSPEIIKRVAEYVRAGVLDSATIGEFRSEVWENLFKRIESLKGEQSVVRTFWDGLKKGDSGVREFYALMDVWVKVATYEKLKEQYAANYAERGIPVTDEALVREAGFDANLANISFSLATPIAKFLERTTPGFAFATYMTETYRAPIGSLLVAKKMLSRGMIEPAATRIVGTGLATAGIVAATNALLNSYGDDDEELKLQPKWERNNPKILAGLDKDGHRMYLGLSPFDPLGPLNEFITAATRAPDGELLGTLVDQALGMVARNRGISLVYKTLIDAAVGTPGEDAGALSQKITGVGYHDDLVTNMEALAWAFTPAVAKAFIEQEVTQTRPVIATQGSAGTVSKAMGTLMQNLGTKLFVSDPDKAIGYKAKEYNASIESIRSEFSQFLKKNDSVEDTAMEMESLMEREREAFEELKMGFEGYKASGRSSQKFFEAVVATDVPKSTAAAITRSEFTSRLFTLEALHRKEQGRASQLNKSSPTYKEDLAKIQAEYDLLKQAYLRNNPSK